MTAGGSGGGASHPAGDYLAGALAGSANIVVGFPADTVKVRLQNRLNPYSGAWHCATSIVKYEGVSAAGQRCMQKAGWVRRLVAAGRLAGAAVQNAFSRAAALAPSRATFVLLSIIAPCRPCASASKHTLPAGAGALSGHEPAAGGRCH
jgi:hypothetical protein